MMMGFCDCGNFRGMQEKPYICRYCGGVMPKELRRQRMPVPAGLHLAFGILWCIVGIIMIKPPTNHFWQFIGYLYLAGGVWRLNKWRKS